MYPQKPSYTNPLAKGGPSPALNAKKRDSRQKLVDQFLAGRKQSHGRRQR